MAVTERQVEKKSCRVENDEMGTGGNKKGQDKKPMRECTGWGIETWG